MNLKISNIYVAGTVLMASSCATLFGSNEHRTNPKVGQTGLTQIAAPHVVVPINCGEVRMTNVTLNNLLAKVVLPNVHKTAGGGEDSAPLTNQQKQLICENIEKVRHYKSDWQASRSLMMPIRQTNPTASSYFVPFFSSSKDCEDVAVRTSQGVQYVSQCKPSGYVWFHAAWIEADGRLLWWGEGRCGVPPTEHGQPISGPAEEICGDNDQTTAKFIAKLFEEYPHVSR